LLNNLLKPVWPNRIKVNFRPERARYENQFIRRQLGLALALISGMLTFSGEKAGFVDRSKPKSLNRFENC
jgi:hypothetical protein